MILKKEVQGAGPESSVPMLREVLCDSVRLRPAGLGSGVIDWATKNKISPFLARKLIEQDIGDAELLDWAQEYRNQCIRRSQAVLNELQAVYREFDASGIAGVVVVENFGTLVATGGDIGNFGSGDVDLMGPRAEAERIGGCIKRAGWRRTVRRGVSDHIMTTFEKDIEGAVFYLNIEWKFVSRRFFAAESRLAQRMEFWRQDGMIRRCSGIDVLAADANFYLNCMHVSIGHYYGTNPGLRLYKDIEPYLSGGHEVSFERVMAWADEDGTRRRLETCLSLYQTQYDDSIRLPVTVSHAAARLAEQVGAIMDPRQVRNFSRLQEVRIDQLSEGMMLAAYLASRLKRSLSRA